MYCNSLNPANDIFWLRELINTQKKESLYKMAIYRCDYKGSQGFLVVTYVNPPFCQYYNCRGDLICQLGGSSNLKTCEDFPENATLGNLVFRDTTAAKPF